MVKTIPANSADVRGVGLIPGSGRFSGEGNGNPLQYSCLRNPIDRESGGLQSMGSQTVGIERLLLSCGFPGGSDGKASACNAGDPGLIPGLGKIPWRRKWQPTPVLLPGKFHGQRSLVGYSPWGRKELDKTEQLHFHFQLYSLIIYTLSKNVEGELHIHLNN